jgi:hypothetical protein
MKVVLEKLHKKIVMAYLSADSYEQMLGINGHVDCKSISSRLRKNNPL